MKTLTPTPLIYGIQGGIGSFNEMALLEYVKTHRIKNWQVQYLYTTEKVLNALDAKKIDFGLFAIQNSVGGMVTESIMAMGPHKFHIVEQFAIRIRHMLMRTPGTQKITGIMAHDQVFKQCQATLRKKYPYLTLKSGIGDMADTAKAAEALYKGKLKNSIAILGPERLSQLYNLEIIDRDLQDDKINDTDFLLVKR